MAAMGRTKKTVALKEVIPGLVGLTRAFWPQIRARGHLIVLSGLALLCAVGARLLEPWPLKFIFDWIIVPSDSAPIPESALWLHSLDPVSDAGMLLAILAFTFLAIAGVRVLSEYLASVGMALAATRIVTDIRARMFGHLQRLSLRFHHKAKSGDLITRFTYDMERLRDTAVTALLPLVANLLTIVLMFAVMFWFNWQLALIPLIVTPFFYLSSLRTGNKIQSVVREHRKRDGALAATAAEAIGAIKLVQALDLGRLQEKAFAAQNKKSLKQGAKAQRLAAALERKVEFILAIATALVLWHGVHLVIAGAITPGTLILFITYLKFVFRPMRQVAKYVTKISRATASGERVMEILETAPEIKDRPGAITAPRFRGRIQFESVSFGYDDNKPILSDVSFGVQPGERVALVGSSGSGKSTIISLLLRLYDPQAGRVLIDGQDILDLKVDSVRRQIGVVLQESLLFGVSIRDNISYGGLDADQEAVESAARLANAHTFISELEDGYDTVIGERGATLSGGQLQRIAIARAAIRGAPIMILDEPTLALDNVNRREVTAALERNMQGKSVIMVTHDLLESKNFDRIVVIEKGSIVEQGTHEVLMQRRGHYHALYSHQANDNRVDLEKYRALTG
jgi:ATP-binding cassette subfamily B protein